MLGWNGRILRVSLSKEKAKADKYDAKMAKDFLGGRGFAAKILWDELRPGIDPLSPENRLVFAAGPLTGFTLPSSGKLVVAAKSPLTWGYGDGNIGTIAAVQMRKAGYDAVVIEGKAKNPLVLMVRDESVDFFDAKEYWGMSSSETERRLSKPYGRMAGILCIGQAGENFVKYANIVSQEGRAGGRPGMGAVMGSKNLKAVVFIGTNDLAAFDANQMKDLGEEAYREVLAKPNFLFWKRQGTMTTIEWSQENSVLPTCNYREGVFKEAERIGGFSMERMKISNRGCPMCNMTCGNVVKDSERKESELDYENVAMLGSNIGLGNLKSIAALNRMADEYGLDAISLGNVLGFAMEASEKRLIKEEVPWGKYKATKALIADIALRRGYLGNLLADGVYSASQEVGGESALWAMHVKGLETSAYDCHTTPGMALAYATSCIGAHHKDAWVISWEVKSGREGYGTNKVDKVIELQRVRGGVFECLTVCRLPWIELGFELEWYPRFLHAATGIEMSWNTLESIGDRVFNLVRAFWVREFGSDWNAGMDFPPARWFEEPLTEGTLKGKRLDRNQFSGMLHAYYEKRGWDERGIPRASTLMKLGLEDVARNLGGRVKMSP
jgi:aldehyde:ferredoxin oxidoreductase